MVVLNGRRSIDPSNNNTVDPPSAVVYDMMDGEGCSGGSHAAVNALTDIPKGSTSAAMGLMESGEGVGGGSQVRHAVLAGASQWKMGKRFFF